MNATACYFVNGMESETSAIARGLRRRDPDLLDRLIEQYQHRLLRYLVSLTADRAIAEDLFQETWMRVLERGHQYDGRHEFSTWLYTIARNLTIDHLRRKRPAVSLDALMEAEDSALPYEPASAGPSALETVAQHEVADLLWNAAYGSCDAGCWMSPRWRDSRRWLSRVPVFRPGSSALLFVGG